MKKIIGLIIITGISYGASVVTPPGIQVVGGATNNNVMVYSDGALIDSGVAPTNLVSVTNLTADIEELQANSIDSEVWAGVSNAAYGALYLDGTTNKTLIDASIAGTTNNLGTMATEDAADYVRAGTNVYTVTAPSGGVRTYDFNDDWLEYRKVPLMPYGTWNGGNFYFYGTLDSAPQLRNAQSIGLTSDGGDQDTSTYAVHKLTASNHGMAYNVPDGSTNITVRLLIGDAPGCAMRITRSLHRFNPSNEYDRFYYNLSSDIVATGGYYNITVEVDPADLSEWDYTLPQYHFKLFSPATGTFPTNSVYVLGAFADTIFTNESAKVLSSLIKDLQGESF